MTLRSLFRRRTPPSTGDPPPPPATGAERYTAGDLVFFPLGTGTMLVHCRTTGRARAVAPEAADLLRRSAGFATLEDHARARCRELGLDGEHASAVRAQLEELAEAGLMVAWREIAAAAPSDAPAPPPITAIGLVTRNRLDVLLRAVASYAENAREHGREVEIVVTDDSPAPPARATTRTALGELGRRVGLRVLHGGLEEKAAFAAALARESGVGPAVIEFALFDPETCDVTIGANHNALALATAGERVFSADDDTVCRLARMPGAAGLALHAGPEPTEFHFFPHRAAALDALPAEAADLLALHEGLLGRRVADVVAAALARGESVEIAPPMLRAMRGDGRVAVTLNALLGDSGMGSPRYYLGLEGPSRERLVRSEKTYAWARATRELARGARATTVSDTSFCMGAFLALDHGQLLPPFFPVCRNSDGVFGVTVRAVREADYLGFLPWTLLHAPREARRYDTEAPWRHGTGISTADLVITAIASFPPPPGETDGAARMRLLGGHLRRLAGLPWCDLDERIRLDRYRRAVLWASGLEERLRAHGGAPPAWADDVRRALDHAGETLEAETYTVPRELAAGRPPDDARALAQRLLRRYGELLEAWPVLTEAARRLRAREERLVRPA